MDCSSKFTRISRQYSDKRIGDQIEKRPQEVSRILFVICLVGVVAQNMRAFYGYPNMSCHVVHLHYAVPPDIVCMPLMFMGVNCNQGTHLEHLEQLDSVRRVHLLM